MSPDPSPERYCLECGSPVEKEAEFCYICGSKRVISIDHTSNRVILEKGECPFCKHLNVPEAKFCAKCGQRIGTFEYTGVKRKLTTYDYLIIALAVVPGAMNLFGLGHLLLKQYSRAFMYLIISAVLLYVRWFTPGLSISMLLVIEFIGLAVFMKQAIEVMKGVQLRQGGN